MFHTCFFCFNSSWLRSNFCSWIILRVITSFILRALDITSYAVGIKICAIKEGKKKYKSSIKKKKNKHDKIVFLGKDKLNTIKF